MALWRFSALVPIFCYKTFSPDATDNFLHVDLRRTNFIFYNIKSFFAYSILHFSVCLHACCFYYPGPASPGPRAPSPLKHEACAKSCWLLALQESLWGSDFISHNPELSGCSSSRDVGLAVAKNSTSFLCRECSSALNPPVRMFGFPVVINCCGVFVRVPRTR